MFLNGRWQESKMFPRLNWREYLWGVCWANSQLNALHRDTKSLLGYCIWLMFYRYSRLPAEEGVSPVLSGLQGKKRLGDLQKGTVSNKTNCLKQWKVWRSKKLYEIDNNFLKNRILFSNWRVFEAWKQETNYLHGFLLLNSTSHELLHITGP